MVANLLITIAVLCSRCASSSYTSAQRLVVNEAKFDKSRARNLQWHIIKVQILLINAVQLLSRLTFPSVYDKICSSLGFGKAEDEMTGRLRSVMTLLRSSAEESVAVQTLNARGDDILELNVGGKLMSTTRETLTQVVC